MIVLGIESSCDETAFALLKNGREVLSSKIASQSEQHALYGGVIPEIAAREHLRSLMPLFQETLSEAGLAADAIDLICVTQGPGLIGALLVGVSFAKGLANALAKPLVPVNHVHAHVHGALLGLAVRSEEVFPCLALVISGGHTNLYWMTGSTDFQLLAASIDDACGESFDKVAKLLGLGYPGGPLVEALANKGNANVVAMPRILDQRERMAFSYSGLKTHVRYLLAKENDKLSPERSWDICAAFQREAFDQIIRKLQTALTLHPTARSVLVSGGVAANSYFRNVLTDAISLPCYFPDLKYCSDNAAMIAAYGWHIYEGTNDLSRFHNFVWEAYSRYEETPIGK